MSNNGSNGTNGTVQTGTFQVKSGLAQMLKGGVIMDVVTAEQAKIAEDAGACAVMALERVPADIRASGGVAVFAHPFARRRGRVVDEAAIAQFAAAGLGGIEVDHPDHTDADRARLRSMAEDLDLIVTGSSDYHGTNKTIELGAETTDPAQFEALVAAASSATLPIAG